MARPGAAFPFKTSGVLAVAAEELLRALAVVIVGPEEIEAAQELPLHSHLQRMIALQHVGSIGFADTGILRIRLKQAAEGDLLLVAKLSGKLGGRQIIEEGIGNRGAQKSLVLVADLRVGEVESLGVRIVASDIGK